MKLGIISDGVCVARCDTLVEAHDVLRRCGIDMEHALRAHEWCDARADLEVACAHGDAYVVRAEER